MSTFIGGLGKTWQWLAPEVIDADSTQFDQRSDIYSFGVVMWEILTREYPFSEYKVILLLLIVFLNFFSNIFCSKNRNFIIILLTRREKKS